MCFSNLCCLNERKCVVIIFHRQQPPWLFTTTSDAGGSLLHLFTCFSSNVRQWCLHAISLHIHSQISAACPRVLSPASSDRTNLYKCWNNERKDGAVGFPYHCSKKLHHGSWCWIICATSNWWSWEVDMLWLGQSIQKGIWNEFCLVYETLNASTKGFQVY